MGDWFEFVVEEQLGQHEQKAEGVHAVHNGLNGPAVPGFVWGEDEAVNGSACLKKLVRNCNIRHSICSIFSFCIFLIRYESWCLKRESWCEQDLKTLIRSIILRNPVHSQFSAEMYEFSNVQMCILDIWCVTNTSLLRKKIPKSQIWADIIPVHHQPKYLCTGTGMLGYHTVHICNFFFTLLWKKLFRQKTEIKKS